MSLAVSNTQISHRGAYGEVTGDGASTSIVLSLSHLHRRAADTGTAFVVVAPTTYTHKSGRGGFLFPEGTAVAVSSAVVSGGNVSITTQSAIGNGTKAYVAFVLDQESARN